ncbi:MAG: hypothetical protein ABSG54_02050 [Terriglobia bacterium]|jgi:hypothetical protein
MTMTLMDAEAPKRHGVLRRYLFLWIALAVVFGSILFIRFRNYSEERAVSRFLATLQEGRYREAYQLWQPSSSYTYEDFLRGWGEMGDYGKIRGFEILGSRSRGSTTVIVVVRINNVDPPIDLLVDRKTKGLAYSIF